MKPSIYVKCALHTAAHDIEAIQSRLSEDNIMLLHGAMGASTEANELLDHLKKVIFYGREIDKVNLKEEIGDIMWYMAIMLDTLDSSFEEVMETNVKKLKKRYPNGFEEILASNRNLQAERKILEGNDE